MALHFTKLSSKLIDDYKEGTQYVDEITQRLFPKEKLNGMTYIPEIPCECVVDLATKNALPQPCFASAETFDALIKDFDLKEKYDEVSKLIYDNIELAKEIFLAQGEEMTSERITYLESSFKNYPKGTVAFVRETNLSEYCLIIYGYIVLDSKTRDASSSDLVRIEKPDIQGILQVREITVNAVAGHLANGLVSGVEGKIGVDIFNAIFSSSMTDFVDEVYKTIQKIVDDALTEETIAQLNGKIYGSESWVRNTYTSLKEGGTYTPKMLTEELNPREQELAIDVVGVLTDERYEKPGICVFMIGAGMHLAMLQELAYQDYTVENAPDGSAWLEAVKKWAKEYGDHATKTVNDIVAQRLAMIRTTSHMNDSMGLHITEMQWIDDYDGRKSDKYTIVYDFMWNECENHQDEFDKDLQNHKDQVKKDLIEQMDDPQSTADEWHKLETNPLPPSE